MSVVVIFLLPRSEVSIDPRSRMGHIRAHRRISNTAIAAVTSSSTALQSPRRDTNYHVVRHSGPRSTRIARARSRNKVLSRITTPDTDHGVINIGSRSQCTGHDVLAQLVLQNSQRRRLQAGGDGSRLGD